MRYLTPSLSCLLLQLSRIFWFPGFQGRQKGRGKRDRWYLAPSLSCLLLQLSRIFWFPGFQGRQKGRGKRDRWYLTSLLSPISLDSVYKTRKKINAILNAVPLLPFASIIKGFLVSWFPRQAKGAREKRSVILNVTFITDLSRFCLQDKKKDKCDT